jgi:hypothetical protein
MLGARGTARLPRCGHARWRARRGRGGGMSQSRSLEWPLAWQGDGNGQGEVGGRSPGKVANGEGTDEVVAATFQWWVWLQWSPAGSSSPCGAEIKERGGGEGRPNRGG